MSLGKYFSSSTEHSSLRLNMFIATISFVPAILSVAFNIIWKTVHNVEPSWAEVSLFVTTGAAYFTAIWLSKKANKEAETKALNDKCNDIKP